MIATVSCGRKLKSWLGAVALAAGLVGGLSAAPQPAVAESGLFGTIEHRSSNLIQFRKWTDVLKRAKAEQVAWSTNPHLVEWQRFLDSIQDKPRHEQIELVNDFANRVQYRRDYVVWGRSDYWATPGEFFTHGGDCEDFVVVKYLSLRQLGFEVEDLRLVVVQDRKRNEAHAVLAVTDGGRRYILDNQIDEIVHEDYAARRYGAYYSINERNWWMHETS